MSLALIAALPFLGALLPGLMIRAGRDAAALTTAAVTGLALLGILLNLPAVLSGEEVTARFSWLPQVGLAANFRLDGLALLFALLILGIGLLIILYARFYLSERDPVGRFYTYLLLFQGAMLGIVLSDNILLLLVFWELTSLSSFLLIGYWHHLPEGRQGARMALAVTGAGGLAMIAGLLILGQAAGSYDLSGILSQKAAVQASPWYLPALVLILLGAFTKSAQFPFHFWLPHAMAAPTPVSAYLHSATMVKAGLFLMARLWPVLAGTPEWFYIVATTGLVTMAAAAKIAFFKDDLKAILAFSTVSHLGLITMLLGFGTEAAAVAAVLHILNHATFKAALFMTAGIVDHETHTRDARRLGGLASLMPVTFTIAAVTGLSMAGIPPFNGFISKEMMLDEASHTVWAGLPWLLPALATAGALLSVAYSLRYVSHVFLGPVRDDYPHHPHDPAPGMWAPPALLAALVIAIGLAPMTVAGWLVEAASAAVTGGHPHLHLALWHGLTPAFWLSLVAIGGGAVALLLHAPLARAWAAFGLVAAKPVFDRLMALIEALSAGLTLGLHDGRMSRALAAFALAAVGGGLFAFATGSHAAGLRPLTATPAVAAICWFLLVVAAGAVAWFHHQRAVALALVGIVGLMISIAFVVLSAPDLALTQILVDVVTVLLLLIALNFLPRETPREHVGSRRLRDAAIAGTGGLSLALLSWALMTRDFAFPTTSAYHLAHAKTEGGGTNVVNVILVDFRGYDTFGEITVLGIAALLIFALTEALLRGAAGRRLIELWQGRGQAGDRHPLMLVVGSRVMMPVAMMIGIFLFLRGHNAPGGGFIAGLVIAIALLMHYIASGFAWAHRRKRTTYHGLIGSGVLAAGLTGVGAWFAGKPFLTSAFGYFHLPVFGEVELATAMLFDTGVFLAVLGAVMLALSSLSRLARQAGETVNERPMDTDLSAGATAPAPAEAH